MVAYCRLRKAIRIFRLDRIRSFEVLTEHFERPSDFSVDRYITESLETQPFQVHIRFDATQEEVRRVFGDIGDVTPAGSGNDYVGPTADFDFTARILLFSCLSFRVLAPPELKEAFARIADSARKLAG